MKIQYQILLYLTVLATVAISCFEDEGKYDYDPVNTPKIEGIYNNHTLVPGELYEIFPEIDYGDASENDFDYIWVTNEYDTLCTTKNFSYTFTRTGWYKIIFLVIEKSTGARVTKYFELTVNSVYFNGWIVLSDLNGKSSLTHIRPMTDNDENGDEFLYYIPYPDVYNKTFYPDELGNGPLQLATHYGDYDQVIVMQTGSDAVVLDGSDYSKVITLKEEFMAGDYPTSTFVPKMFQSAGRLELLFGVDGDMYQRTRTYTSYFQTVKYSEVKPLESRITKYAYLPEAQYIIVYDETNKKMICIVSDPMLYTGMIIDVELDPEEENDGSFTDLNNMGENIDLIYTEMSSYEVDQSTWSSYYYMKQILKIGNEYHLQSFRNSLYAYAGYCHAQSRKQKLFAASDIVSDNTIYKSGRGEYLYFAENNTLYYYDGNTNSYASHYTFNSDISSMEFDRITNYLAVGLENGEFYIFDMEYTNLGNGGSTIVFSLSDLGRIVDVKYKYGNQANYKKINGY